MAGGGGDSDLPGVNMTAMCDVIFILIVFFIFTVKMEEATLSDTVKIPEAPNAAPVTKKDPRTIIVEIGLNGDIMINRRVLSTNQFEMICRKVYGEQGEVPVVIAADTRTKHKFVRKVMDICSRNGFWRLKFMAVKEGN